MVLKKHSIIFLGLLLLIPFIKADPLITLGGSPSDGYTSTTGVVTFTFTYNNTNASVNGICNLFVNGINRGTNNTCINNVGSTIVSSTIPDGNNLAWLINCSNGTANSVSASRTITVSSNTPVVISGGGATTQEQISGEEYDAAVSVCEQQNGSLVNIKGVIYCKNGETYTALDKLTGSETDTITVMGLNIPNFGKMVSENNPSIGWIIIIAGLIIIYSLYKDQREIRLERNIRRIPKKESEKERSQEKSNDRRRRRSDGGYY